MKRGTLLLFMMLAFASNSFAQMPVYDKAKHYQLRSMETGPWEFHPPGWYYSWWTKHGRFLWWDVKWRLPGLGVHDNGPAGIGGGDKYVTKYSPNKTRRAIMLVQAQMSKKKYEAISASIKEVHQREMLDVADRSLDIVYKDYDPMFVKLNILMQKKILEYRNMIGVDDQLSEFILEYNKIKDSIEFMRKNYVKNVDRQKSYLSELKNLEKLIVKCNNVLKAHYFINSVEEMKRYA